MPSDTRFKILVFTGNLTEANDQRVKLDAFSKAATTEGGFLNKFGNRGQQGWTEVFELLTIVSGKRVMILDPSGDYLPPLKGGRRTVLSRSLSKFFE